MDDIINLKPFNTYFLDALEFYEKKKKKKSVTAYPVEKKTLDRS